MKDPNIGRTGWLTYWARKRRLKEAVKANYDPWPNPPMRWYRRWVKIGGVYGMISETGWFEPSDRLRLYPEAYLPEEPDPLDARRR